MGKLMFHVGDKVTHPEAGQAGKVAVVQTYNGVALIHWEDGGSSWVAIHQLVACE